MARFLPFGLALLLASASGGGCVRPPAPPDIVLLVVDALRADRLGVGGNSRPASPFLDALAARGAWFPDAWAPAPWTLPSMASLLTGLHPLVHGAGLEGEMVNMDEQVPKGLREGIPTLATLLSKAGYRCEAFVTNPFLGLGSERGFETWHLATTEAADVAEFGLARLAAPDDRPLFLFLHFVDLHDPILVPDEDALAVTSGEASPSIPPPWARYYLAFTGDAGTYREQRLIAYDAAVHYVDRHVGRLLEAIRRREERRGVLVLVTADHGEEIFDWLGPAEEARQFDPRGRRGYGHGHSLSGVVLRVPLIVAGPGIPARQVPDQVSLLDVAPTALDLAGVRTAGARFDGRSLRPLLEGGALPARPLLAGSVAYGFRRRAWITPSWKLILSDNPEECPLLFDRRNDPGQQVNLAPRRPDLVEDLAAAARAAEERIVRSSGGRSDLSEEDRLRLRALGYLGDDR